MPLLKTPMRTSRSTGTSGSAFRNTQYNSFWSSSPADYDVSVAWVLSGIFGNVYLGLRVIDLYYYSVRCAGR
jgi:hypothetical protein